MNTLGIILARAGSQGLPGKHVKPLLGRPVIDWTFGHARAAGRLDRVVVSTDCPQIRQLAKSAMFQTIDRPPTLATGEASVQDVLLHATDAVEQRGDFRADAIVVIYGNVPARGAGVIDCCVERLAAGDCDSVRTFCPVGKWHPQWMSTLGGEGGDEVFAEHPGSIHRRQDLRPLMLHDGACVAVTRRSLELGRQDRSDPHAFFGTRRAGVRTASGETVEVDEPRDLFLAEATLRAAGESGRMRQAS
jgi:N-acylneuraminate cytidylyltransferase